jgi:hypothetical protein
VKDLALDPTTGDLLLESTGGASAARLTDASTGESQAQRLYLRLSLWRTEYIPDARVGMPYDVIFGRKGTLPILTSVVRGAVATCPGIARLLEYGVAFDAAARVATIDPLRAQADDGSTVDLSGLVVAAAELRLPGGTPSDETR